IIHDGIRRMYEQQENVFYYITTLNENYVHPPMPTGAEDGIRRGMYLFKAAEEPLDSRLKVHILGSGAIMNEVIAAAELLQMGYGVQADVWSVTSYSELRREGASAQRWSMLHPDEPKRLPYVTSCFADENVPVVASSDYMKLVADQIRPFIRNHFTTLGTDGFGRSDTRQKLRHHFEVDRYFIVVAALNALADKGYLGRSRVADALRRYEIEVDLPDPVTR
ncbi:MAG: pyruvate dehydrogenase (acetyl-transferring), homodimeric type, partial [Gammaproteobacteria bacterium]